MKKKRIILGIFIILFFILLVFSIYKIFVWNVSNKENEFIQKELDNIVNENEIITEEKYNIDFDKLKRKNQDTVAYLEVNNTKIKYVVVKGKNNSYYLNHNFNKKYNVAGWIFADYHNKFNGKDKNIVIFGHNMKNNSMFGTLKNVLKKEWQKDKNNHRIVLVDELGTHYYQVFSTYQINVEEYYINTRFKNDNEFYDFIKVLKKRSNYDYNVKLKKTDRILTLSTCSAGGTKRVVLHAKLIDDNDL